MTHIEQAIREAVKGGWDGEWDNVCGAVKHLSNGRNVTGNEHAFLDSSFWQALAKAHGEGRHFSPVENDYVAKHAHLVKKCNERCIVGFFWREEWHRFIDHLANGKDAESFFKELV